MQIQIKSHDQQSCTSNNSRDSFLSNGTSSASENDASEDNASGFGDDKTTGDEEEEETYVDTDATVDADAEA